MVSVFEGQLSRTWFFNNQGRNHVISLYHDTITGVRSAMLDFIEIRGATGNSSLMMEAKGHRLFFSVDNLPGYIEIKRSGWTGFSYACVIDNVKVPEATERVAGDQSEVFKVKITGTTTTPDEMASDSLVTWYIVQTTRLEDGVSTEIHRRFRDFSELNSQVKQNFKGHHLREALPPLPEKPLKSLTDHKDPQFIMDRQLKLEVYLSALVSVPHVSHMVCVKAFLGLMEQVREYSISFHVPQLGLSLLPLDNNPKSDGNTPAIVGTVVKPEVCRGVLAGDTISKINGVAVAGTNFQGIIARIKLLPRPMIVHFIQVIGATAENNHNSIQSPGKPLSSATAASSTAAVDADDVVGGDEGHFYVNNQHQHHQGHNPQHTSATIKEEVDEEEDSFMSQKPVVKAKVPTYNASAFADDTPSSANDDLLWGLSGSNNKKTTTSTTAPASSSSSTSHTVVQVPLSAATAALFDSPKASSTTSTVSPSPAVNSSGIRADRPKGLFGEDETETVTPVKKAVVSGASTTTAASTPANTASTPVHSVEPVITSPAPAVAAPAALSWDDVLVVDEGHKEEVPARVEVVEQTPDVQAQVEELTLQEPAVSSEPESVAVDVVPEAPKSPEVVMPPAPLGWD